MGQDLLDRQYGAQLSYGRACPSRSHLVRQLQMKLLYLQEGFAEYIFKNTKHSYRFWCIFWRFLL